MVSTPEGFTEKRPMSSGPSVSVKQPNASKSLRKFLETLDFKPNTAVRRLCTDKSNTKAIRACSVLWSSTPRRRGYRKNKLTC